MTTEILKIKNKIDKAYKYQDYELVCFQSGKLIEFILNRKEVNPSSNNGVPSKVNNLKSRGALKPKLAEMMIDTWKLRNIASHENNFNFRKKHALSAINTFNEVLKWNFSDFIYDEYHEFYFKYNTKVFNSTSSIGEAIGRGDVAIGHVLCKKTLNSYIRDKYMSQIHDFDYSVFCEKIIKQIIELNKLNPTPKRLNTYYDVANHLEKSLTTPSENSSLIKLISIFLETHKTDTNGDFLYRSQESIQSDLVFIDKLNLGPVMEEFKSLIPKVDYKYVNQMTINI